MQYVHINQLLNSSRKEDIVKALMILCNNPKLEFEDRVRELSELKIDPLVTALSLKFLKKLQLFKEIVPHRLSDANKDSQDQTSLVNMTEADKYRTLKAVRLGQKKFDLTFSEAVKMFNSEDSSRVEYLLGHVISDQFPSKALDYVNKVIADNSELKVKAFLLLVFIGKPEHQQTILNEYNVSESESFLIAASKYLWKNSQIIVISKIKELAESPKTPLRIIASKLCRLLACNELRGIIQLLLDEPNETIRTNSKAALIDLKEDIIEDQPEWASCSDNIFQKLEGVLRDGIDFQSKISAIKVLDNLNNGNFVEIVAANLKTESNSFLISAYVKYLGKFGKDQYYESLIGYLDHEDPRVVSNCIEGLNYSRNKAVIQIMKKYIKDRHHRISSNAALVLWNMGDVDIVKAYLGNAVNSKKLWKRKSALHILEKLNDPVLADYVTVMDKDKNPEIRERIRNLTDKKEEDPESSKIMSYLMDTGKIPQKIIEEHFQKLTDKKVPLKKRLKTAEMLGYMLSEEHISEVIGLFDEGGLEEQIRASLVKTIGIISKDPVSFLVSCLRSNSPYVRAAAVKSLWTIDVADLVEDLFPLLFDEDVEVVCNAAILLNQYVPEEVEKKIKSMALSDDRQVKKTALSAILLVGTENLYRIAQFLLKDSDTEVLVMASSVVADLHNKHKYPILEEVEEPPAEINPVEFINSMSDVKDPAVIAKKIAEIQDSLQVEHLNEMLSLMETTENVVLLSKLVILLGKFSHDESAIGMMRRLLGHHNDRVAANTIEALIETDQAILFEEIFSMLPDASERKRLAILKLMFFNPIYGQKIIDALSRSEYDRFVNIFIPEHVMERISKPKIIEKIVEVEVPAKSPPPEKAQSTPKTGSESATGSVKPAKVPPKRPVKSVVPVNVPFTEKYSEELNKLGIGVICLVVIFFVFKFATGGSESSGEDLLIKNVSKDKIVEESSRTTVPVIPDTPVKTPDTRKTPKVNFNFPEPPVSIEAASEKWKEITQLSSLDVRERTALLMTLVEILENQYFSGQFFLVKKALEAKKIDQASSGFDEVLGHLKKGEVLIEAEKGVWMPKESVDEMIFEQVKKEKSEKKD